MFINRGVLMVGAYIALTNETSVGVGALVAFMMLGGRVTQPLVGLARLIEDFQDVRASVGEVGSVLNNRPEQQSGAGLRPAFEGNISFEELTFTYPTGKTPALEKVNFAIPAGTMLGVVGRSGSGKSTLTRLLQGVNREYNGFLKIDGAELREINLAHLRRSFGVVLQDNFLFRGTVRDNITAGRPGLTIEDVVRAARLAGAEEFIERLPLGYDTWIEEGSANISGGQKQRLAIARALITDPRILILDEATSALDPESEALVNANLTRIGRGRTMIIVSHRLTSLVDCDLILVMDKGRVMDIAPHTVLLERCAIYRALWLQQNRHIWIRWAPARRCWRRWLHRAIEGSRTMSVTTTGGTRLTRGQSAQMPALLEFYSPSAALLETREKGPARGVIWSVASLFAACALAAGLIPIDKVVTASGKVTAVDDTIVVQPLETSIVREIDVQEGQVVHKGDLLARLDPTFTTSDKTALSQSVGSLRAEVERRQAEASGVDYKPTTNDAAAQVQMSIFAQRKAERTFRLENYRQKIDSLQANLGQGGGGHPVLHRSHAGRLHRREQAARVAPARLGQPVERAAGDRYAGWTCSAACRRRSRPPNPPPTICRRCGRRRLPMTRIGSRRTSRI